jgi:hypothetical protein
MRKNKLPSRAVHASPIIHRGRPYHSAAGEPQAMHPTERYMRFGKVQPMQEKRGLLARLFGGGK